MSKVRLVLIRALASKRDNEGFTLVELVVVIATLAILGAVAIPSFVCLIPKSRATAALAAMQQIQKECIIKKSFDEQEIFSDNNLQGYQMSTNNCKGTGANGLISAIPDDTEIAPTFILDTKNDELSYNFRGKTGTDLNICLKMICGNVEPEHDPNLDPIHGDECDFRTAVYRGDGKTVMTGCYYKNKFMKDPCALTRAGCNRWSFTPSHGQGVYPCVSDGKKYNFRQPKGRVAVQSRPCNSPRPEPKWRNCYCFPPKNPCLCDDGFPTDPRPYK